MYNEFTRDEDDMTIYIDILFIINLVADLAINYTTSVLCDSKVRVSRLILVSITDAIYGILAIQFPFFSLKIILGLFIIINIYMLFGMGSKKQFIKRVITYCFTCIIAAGICRLFLKTSNYAVSYNGYTFFPTSDISIYLSMIILSMSSGYIKKIFAQKRYIYNVILRKQDKKIKTTAYYDTGNTLTFNQRPVIIVNEKIFNKFSSDEKIEIAYTTVSEKMSVMQGIHIDEIYFPNENISICDIYCGVGHLKLNVLLHKNTYP